jgi:hypothetical protein
MKPAAWAETLLLNHWWQPKRTMLSWALQPLAWGYGQLELDPPVAQPGLGSHPCR